MLSTANVSIQFGAKPLFEQVTVKFADGNRYGLIGANGCGKSTFMKILGGELEQSSGEVMLQTGMRLGKLNQNQFAYEDERVLDVVMQGHVEMWQAMKERDLIYADAHATDDDYMHAAELEAQVRRVRRLRRRSARRQHPHRCRHRPVRCTTDRCAKSRPGWKLRVLLAQALFSKPDVLLLDEPTNNLDINSIRWLEGVLNDYDATMIIISHDRHFLNQVCTHMADLDFGQLKIYPGQLRRLHAGLDAGARSASRPRTPRPRTASRTCRSSCVASRPMRRRRARRPRGASRSRRSRSRRSSPPRGRIPTSASSRARSCIATPSTVENLSFRYPDSNVGSAQEHQLQRRSRRAHRDHRPERHRQDDADALLAGDLQPDDGHDHLGGERAGRLHAAGSAGRVREEDRSVHLDERVAGEVGRRSDRARHARAPAVLRRRDPRSPSRCCPAARRAA